MATETITEGHGKNSNGCSIFSGFSVDSVAIPSTDSRLKKFGPAGGGAGHQGRLRRTKKDRRRQVTSTGFREPTPIWS